MSPKKYSNSYNIGDDNLNKFKHPTNLNVPNKPNQMTRTLLKTNLIKDSILVNWIKTSLNSPVTKW